MSMNDQFSKLKADKLNPDAQAGGGLGVISLEEPTGLITNQIFFIVVTVSEFYLKLSAK